MSLVQLSLPETRRRGVALSRPSQRSPWLVPVSVPKGHSPPVYRLKQSGRKVIRFRASIRGERGSSCLLLRPAIYIKLRNEFELSPMKIDKPQLIRGSHEQCDDPTV